MSIQYSASAQPQVVTMQGQLPAGYQTCGQVIVQGQPCQPQVVYQQQPMISGAVNINAPATPAASFSSNVSISPQLLQQFQQWAQQPVGDVGRALILRVDPATGAVVVAGAAQGSVDQIKSQVSTTEPRFIVYRGKGSNGQVQTGIIYTTLANQNPQLKAIYDKYLGLLQQQLQIKAVSQVDHPDCIVMQLLNGVIDTAVNIASGIVSTGAGILDAGINVATGLAGGVVQTGAGILNAGINAATGLAEGVVNVGSQVLNTGIDVISDAAGTAVDLAEDVVGAGLNVVGGVVETGANLLGGVVDTAANVVGAGANLLTGVAETGVNLLGGLAKAATGIVGGLTGSLAHGLGGALHH